MHNQLFLNLEAVKTGGHCEGFFVYKEETCHPEQWCVSLTF